MTRSCGCGAGDHLRHQRHYFSPTHCDPRPDRHLPVAGRRFPGTSGSSFSDVSADAYYAQAVAWAVKENITAGTSASTFSPDAHCTRAQIVTFLYRAFSK